MKQENRAKTRGVAHRPMRHTVMGLWPLFFVPHVLGLYYALQAYNGKRIELPVLSKLGRNQG